MSETEPLLVSSKAQHNQGGSYSLLQTSNARKEAAAMKTVRTPSGPFDVRNYLFVDTEVEKEIRVLCDVCERRNKREKRKSGAKQIHDLESGLCDEKSGYQSFGPSENLNGGIDCDEFREIAAASEIRLGAASEKVSWRSRAVRKTVNATRVFGRSCVEALQDLRAGNCWCGLAPIYDRADVEHQAAVAMYRAALRNYSLGISNFNPRYKKGPIYRAVAYTSYKIDCECYWKFSVVENEVGPSKKVRWNGSAICTRSLGMTTKADCNDLVRRYGKRVLNVAARLEDGKMRRLMERSIPEPYLSSYWNVPYYAPFCENCLPLLPFFQVHLTNILVLPIMLRSRN